MHRKMLNRLGLAGIAATLAWALPASAQETPKQGGIMRHVVEQEGTTYDCHATATSFSLQVLAPHYNTLLRFHPEKYPEIVGDLADSWTVSDDRLTYTFKLRQGVKFHDGSDFDSADIKATFDRIRQPPEGITSSRQGQWASIETIETPDAGTVVFKMKQSNPAQLLLFASPWNCVYSAEKLAENANYPATEVMGTGPFTFVEHIQGSSWKAARNENYFDAGKPYLDGIEAVFINGPGIINALAGNQVDAALFSVSPADQERLKTTNPDLVYQNGPFNITNFVTFNLTKAPFDDVRVRQAMNLAVSRAEADQVLPKISVLEGRGLYFPPGSLADRPDEEMKALPGMGDDTEANREQAKALLKEAGHEGLKLTLLNRNLRQPWEPLGIFLLDQWRKIGMDVDQTPAETPQYFAALQSKNYDVSIDFNNTVSVDPNEVLVKFMPGSPNNYSGLDDPKLTEMFNAQAAETDQAERAKIVKEIEAYMIEQAYYIPGFKSKRGIAHHKDMKGWKLPPTTVLNLQLDTVWLDR